MDFGYDNGYTLIYLPRKRRKNRLKNNFEKLVIKGTFSNLKLHKKKAINKDKIKKEYLNGSFAF